MNKHQEYEQCLVLFASKKYDQCVEKAADIIDRGTAHQSIFQMLLISLQRLGRQDDIDNVGSRLLEKTISSPWLNALLKLTLGKLTEEELLRNATNNQQRCDVLYYTGARLKTLGLSNDALEKFKKCLETNVESIEMVLARMEVSDEM